LAIAGVVGLLALGLFLLVGITAGSGREGSGAAALFVGVTGGWFGMPIFIAGGIFALLGFLLSMKQDVLVCDVCGAMVPHIGGAKPSPPQPVPMQEEREPESVDLPLSPGDRIIGLVVQIILYAMAIGVGYRLYQITTE